MCAVKVSAAWLVVLEVMAVVLMSHHTCMHLLTSMLSHVDRLLHWAFTIIGQFTPLLPEQLFISAYIYRLKRPQSASQCCCVQNIDYITKKEKNTNHVWKLDSERESGWLSVCITCMCVYVCVQESTLAWMTHSVVNRQTQTMRSRDENVSLQDSFPFLYAQR